MHQPSCGWLTRLTHSYTYIYLYNKQLCNEDWQWWWRSFLCSGSCALYIFLYSIWYVRAYIFYLYIYMLVYRGECNIPNITYTRHHCPYVTTTQTIQTHTPLTQPHHPNITPKKKHSNRYLSKELDIEGATSYLLYFSHMLVFSLTFFVLTGAIGYFSSFWFITKIYSAIKVD